MKRIKNNSPKISIVIPSFNKVSYIEDTLLSVLNQKYPNLEVIIQDGESTDGSAEIIRKYARKYPSTINFESKKDKGQVDAINKGFKKATGDILAYINADDIYKKDSFKNISQEFIKDPNLLWITGYGDIIDDKSDVHSSLVTKYKNLLLCINKYPFLLMVNYIHQPATFFSRKAYKKYGPFIGTKKYVMEYDMWLKMGRVEMPKVTKHNLASFRLTLDNISATSFDELLNIDNQIAEKYTNNIFLLYVHKFHNNIRRWIIISMKVYERFF